MDPYFAELAELVTAGIEAAGIRDAQATRWRSRRDCVDPWRDGYRLPPMDDRPRAGEGIFSSIAFDHRRVSAAARHRTHAPCRDRGGARRYPDFLRHLARRALDETTHRVQAQPRGGVEGRARGALDIKHGGVTIVANLARLYAMRAGRPEMSTLARLDAAEETGQIMHEQRLALEEAFRLLWQIRLEHQVRQVRANTRPDDFVDPAELGPIVRLGLKEAFRIIGMSSNGSRPKSATATDPAAARALPGVTLSLEQQAPIHHADASDARWPALVSSSSGDSRARP